MIHNPSDFHWFMHSLISKSKDTKILLSIFSTHFAKITPMLMYFALKKINLQSELNDHIELFWFWLFELKVVASIHHQLLEQFDWFYDSDSYILSYTPGAQSSLVSLSEAPRRSFLRGRFHLSNHIII